MSPSAIAGLPSAQWLASPGVAGTPLSSQSLVLLPGALPPRSTVIFRISASDSGGASSADVAVPVAGPPHGPQGPGSLGALSVSPLVGVGLSTVFTIAASGWADDAASLPLAYSFSYAAAGAASAGAGSSTAQTLTSFHPAAALSATLPAGAAASGSVVNVSVTVMNAAGVVAPPVSVSVVVTWDAALLANASAQARPGSLKGL